MLAKNFIEYLNWKETATGNAKDHVNVSDIPYSALESIGTLYSLRRKNPKNVLLSYLNIN